MAQRGRPERAQDGADTGGVRIAPTDMAVEQPGYPVVNAGKEGEPVGLPGMAVQSGQFHRKLVRGRWSVRRVNFEGAFDKSDGQPGPAKDLAELIEIQRQRHRDTGGVEESEQVELVGSDARVGGEVVVSV